MDNNTKTYLESVLSRVLEDWSMMMVEDGNTTPLEIDEVESYYSATAEFSGNIKGQITISCPIPFLNNLAHNLLCLDLDEKTEEQDLIDSLQELTNIVSGNFLTEAFGTEEEFDLPSFKISKINGLEVKNAYDENTVCFLGDEQPVVACCKLHIN